MATQAELAVRHRNRAEELRVIAEDFSGPRREFILTLVKDYDRQAAAEETLAKQNVGSEDS